MKTPKGVRTHDSGELRKAKRLEPMRKNGKERHTLYCRIDDDNDDEQVRPRRESAYDYYEDEE